MARRGKQLGSLRRGLAFLIAGNPLPPEFKGHLLHGEFDGSRDCHIEPDRVLIYTLEASHDRFERTGTHSDIFRN